jgi:hypothetical protein
VSGSVYIVPAIILFANPSPWLPLIGDLLERRLFEALEYNATIQDVLANFEENLPSASVVRWQEEMQQWEAGELETSPFVLRRTPGMFVAWFVFAAF